MLSRHGIDVDARLTDELDGLRSTVQALVTGPPQSGRGSVTTGPW